MLGGVSRACHLPCSPHLTASTHPAVDTDSSLPTYCPLPLTQCHCHLPPAAPDIAPVVCAAAWISLTSSKML